jgi:hypothetical protein
MKKACILFSLVLLGIAATAQENEEINVLFGRTTKVRGFIGPAVELTSIANDFTCLIGVEGGVMLDNFFLGGFGIGLTDNSQLQQDVEFGYGGLFLGYRFLADKVFHPTVSAVMGMGSITSIEGFFPDDHIYVLAPIIELEINFTRFLKVSFGGSYRFVGGISDEGAGSDYSNTDFSGPAGILSFRFGWFD